MHIEGLDSVVFATRDLARVRAFYVDVLGLSVGTFKRDGREVPDESERYVNFHMGKQVVGFEREDRVETGTLVLAVDDAKAWRAHLEPRGIKIERAGDTWILLHDPDGREVILQQS